MQHQLVDYEFVLKGIEYPYGLYKWPDKSFKSIDSLGVWS